MNRAFAIFLGLGGVFLSHAAVGDQFYSWSSSYTEIAPLNGGDDVYFDPVNVQSEEKALSEARKGAQDRCAKGQFDVVDVEFKRAEYRDNARQVVVVVKGLCIQD